MERKLTAILAADVVGYSRLMGRDEERTLDALKALRREVFAPEIRAHGGRIVKLMGDGALVEFISVIAAVECALAIQAVLAERTAGQQAEDAIVLRIGIHVGDVIIQGDDIYGDGVNLAARLEGEAEPGGVAISDDVWRQVRNKLGAAFRDGGERSLKNIDRPMRVYLSGGVAEPEADAEAGTNTETERAALPSIAVLPLANMSGDPEQEFFADGLTEDIITELSRFKELLVISRNSTFVYKGRAVNIQEVARDLDVDYVAEGSVRKAGDRVRVTIQLIETAADRHVWAERYDRKLEDIFDIQDEITAAIVSTLPGRLEAALRDRAKHRPTGNMAAYEYVLTGKVLHHRSQREDNAEAIRMLDRAIALDPDYAHAHAWRGCVLGQAWVYGWPDDPDATWKDMNRSLTTALALDDNDSDVHRILAAANIAQDNHDRSFYHQERALALNPNDTLIVVQQGEILTWLGRAEEGIEWILKAMRLNPYHPERFWNHLGRAYFVAHRYPEAVEAFRHLNEPDAAQQAFLAACHAQMDDTTQAEAHKAKVLDLNPDFTVAGYLPTLHYKNPADLEHHKESLLLAGLPA
ncbi:MAG: adenylate/guanylate cyclase domain-containing protein [Proteobacteria bacterium]|nr:adenylate/guanylate cyclase domain-containing protein [Pseudomonadota bacterium]